MEVLERALEVAGRKVGPEPVNEVEFRIGALPEEEVGQSLFASGPDKEVDVTSCRGQAAGQLLLKWCSSGSTTCGEQIERGAGDGVAR